MFVMKFLIVFVTVLATLATDVVAITNGKSATAKQFPFEARIVARKSGNTELICSGAVIDASYILTAAECLHDAMGATIYLGSNLIGDKRAQSFQVLGYNFRIHDKYDSKTKQFNIALIKSNIAIQFNDNVKPIPLASGLPVIGSEVNVIGWGNKASNEPVQELQYTPLRVIDAAEYADRQSQSIVDLVTDQNMFAVGLDNDVPSGPCDGDAGAPLVASTQGGAMTLIGVNCNIENNSNLGIFSSTTSNCESGRPSVYTNVVYFLDWIQAKTK